MHPAGDHFLMHFLRRPEASPVFLGVLRKISRATYGMFTYCVSFLSVRLPSKWCDRWAIEKRLVLRDGDGA
jgi:hypothetical protein